MKVKVHSNLKVDSVINEKICTSTVTRGIGEVVSLYHVAWGIGSHRLPGLFEVMLATRLESLASPQLRPYCVVKCHILQEVTLLMQNSMDVDLSLIHILCPMA